MYTLKTILPFLLCCVVRINAQTTILLAKGCNADGREMELESYVITFDPSDEAKAIVNQVIDAAGVSANFELRFANVQNVTSTTYEGKRYLLYSNSFLKRFDNPSTYWGAYFMLAHEIGHHLKKHDFDETDPYSIKYNELDADAFAGAALRMFECTLREAQDGLLSLSLRPKTTVRPARSSRLEAMMLGWNRQDKKLKGGSSNYSDHGDPEYLAKACQNEQDLIKRVKEAERQERAPQDEIYLQKALAQRDEKEVKGTGQVAGSTGKPENSGINGDTGDNPFGKGNGGRGGTGGGSGLKPALYSESHNHAKMPNFPWPPPNCYQRKTLVKNLSKKAQSFKDIDDRLQRALDAEGYYQRSYFQTPGGFALVTQMEQYGDDGGIKKRFRWADYPVQEDFDNVWAYFKSLVMPTPGRFRVFVFVVTDQPYPQSEQRLSQAALSSMASKGFSQIPAHYSETEVTNSHFLEALIYEFEAPQSTKRCAEKCPAFLDVQTHLLHSGLSSLIGF